MAQELLRGGEVICPHYKVGGEGMAQIMESEVGDTRHFQGQAEAGIDYPGGKPEYTAAVARAYRRKEGP